MSVPLRKQLQAVLAAELRAGYPRTLVAEVVAELSAHGTPVGPVELRSALSHARHELARAQRGTGWQPVRVRTRRAPGGET